MTKNVVSAQVYGQGTKGSLTAAEFAFKRLTIKRVWIQHPMYKNELDVYWLPATFRRDKHPKGYNVYRANSPRMTIGQQNLDGPLNGTTLIVIPYYRDLTIDSNRLEIYYYVVTEVYEDGSEYPIDEPQCLNNYVHTHLGRRTTTISMPRIFQEYKRRKHIILINDAEVVDLLVRRTAGTRCPGCYDQYYESVGKSDCGDCFGTGFLRGYELLRDVRMRVYSVKETLERQPDGLKLKNNPTGWLVDFPVLRGGDVTIRRNGERYEIKNIDMNIHQGILTEQGFDLFQYEPTHPVYGFTVESDAPTV